MFGTLFNYFLINAIYYQFTSETKTHQKEIFIPPPPCCIGHTIVIPYLFSAYIWYVFAAMWEWEDEFFLTSVLS